VKEKETFCHRCFRVVKTTIAGACVVCGVLVAAPTVSPGQAGAFVPFEPVATAAPRPAADGPHVPESPFSEHVPGPQYGGGTAATTTFADAGAALDALRVSKSGIARTN
jgi:hypothetical protein